MFNVTPAIKIGGIETYYWEVSKELQSRGYDIEIVTGNGPLIKYSDIKLTQFHFTPREKILDLGNRFKKWGERVSFFKNSYPYIKKQNYDTFLIRKPLDFFTCYFMKKLNPNVKTIFISGGEDFYGFDKYFSKYIDYMFAVSHNNAKKIERRYNRKVLVIPNGVDVEKFKPNLEAKKILKEKLNLTDKKILISVGRVVGWKGFQLVIESLQELKDYYYVLIGDGEYLDSLKKLAQKLHVEDKILFLGSIDNKELPTYLNIGDIFLQPSIGHEAFGITIVEAMACGLPIVASKNGGIVDIIENSNAGYMFEIENKLDMCEKIVICYKNKENLSTNAKKHVEENFTWKSCVSKLLKYTK